MDNKKFGTIFNNDSNNILCGMDGSNSTTEDYRRTVTAILDAKPGVFAQNAGLPEAVLYPTEVENTFDKHIVETTALVHGTPDVEDDRAIRQRNFMIKLRESGTDPFTLTIEACRERNVPIVDSYRMNPEGWYNHTWKLSDFGRAHPEWLIPNTGALDPAIPEVYEHRLKIFTEVAERYDIDGIEFDFHRWTHMISSPHENYLILTKMVRETYQMLDETARVKGQKKLLLEVRVGPSLADAPGTEYPGGNVRTDISCRDLGLDVTT